MRFSCSSIHKYWVSIRCLNVFAANDRLCVGLFSLLPREIRDMIYGYALSVDFPDYQEICDCTCPCNCTKDLNKCRSGLGLLQTCRIIYHECLPRLYQEDLFGLSVGYQRNLEKEGPVAWIDPGFYVHLGVERQFISNPPCNVLHLVRKLEVNFINETLLYDDEDNWPFVQCTERYRHAIEQVCEKLKDCTQLQLLDITLVFGCKFADIEYMERLLDPFKTLRGIQEPRVTVHGYEHGDFQSTQVYYSGIATLNVQLPGDPRWTLNEDFAELLESSMTLAHDERLPQTYECEIFMDCSQIPKGEGKAVEEEYRQLFFLPDSNESELMKAYLRDVYDTDDPNFLNGNMPARWQRWLQKKYHEKRASYLYQWEIHGNLVQHPRPLASAAWVIDSTSENKGLRWVPENETLETTDK
jgi:hypothetical protein